MPFQLGEGGYGYNKLYWDEEQSSGLRWGVFLLTRSSFFDGDESLPCHELAVDVELEEVNRRFFLEGPSRPGSTTQCNL